MRYVPRRAEWIPARSPPAAALAAAACCSPRAAWGDLAGIHSARRGTYRILYRINDERGEVVVLRTDHRNEVYRAALSREASYLVSTWYDRRRDRDGQWLRLHEGTCPRPMT